MFHGSITALITPFKNGGLDEQVFQAFVEWQVAEGSDGVVPVGTTGESPTLSHDEHRRVVELCVEAAAGRIPVIAGAGSNSTAEAVELVKHAEEAGADGALLDRGVDDVGQHPGLAESGRRRSGLGLALCGEVHVVPAGEEVKCVPLALPVTQEYQGCGHAPDRNGRQREPQAQGCQQHTQVLSFWRTQLRGRARLGEVAS